MEDIRQAESSPKKQHVDLYRKIKLRKELIEKAGPIEGAYYVPFIGEGNIASALYQGNIIYGGDIDPQRTEVARSRLKDAEIVTADCDKFPFKGGVVFPKYDKFGRPRQFVNEHNMKRGGS